MGLRDALYEGRTSIESPALPLTSTALVNWLGGTPTYAGVAVNERNAVRFIAVYRAVSLVSGVIASMDLKVRRGTSIVQTAIAADPHPDMTAFEFWERVFWQELLSGDAFASKLKITRGPRAGDVIGLDPYPMGTVHPRRVKRTTKNPWGKEFDVDLDDGHKVLTPFDVWHVPGPGYEGEQGLSPIGVARQSLGIGLAAEEFGGRHFGSGSLVSGVLQTDAAVDQGVAETIKARFLEKTRGRDRFHDVAVLDRGLKFVPIGVSPKDAMFLEAIDATVVDVARLYGLPPHLLADVERSTSWGTGIEQQNLALIAFTLGPWMTRAEQRFSKELLPRGMNADFDTASLLRGDLKTRMAAHRDAIWAGFKQPAEARADEGMPPVDGLDKFYVPLNYRPVDEPLTNRDKVEAAKALVSVGYDPEDALKAVGLDPIKHTGILPVTLQKQDTPKAPAAPAPPSGAAT